MATRNVFQEMGLDTDEVVARVARAELPVQAAPAPAAPARRASGSRSHVTLDIRGMEFAPPLLHLGLGLTADLALEADGLAVRSLAINDIPLQVVETRLIAGGGQARPTLLVSARSEHVAAMEARLRFSPVVVEGAFDSGVGFSAYREPSGPTAT